MSITVNALSLSRSERTPSEATAAFKHMITSALKESWSGDCVLPVSMLERNLDGSRKALLRAAIHQLREAGIIEFAYGEGWTVGVMLTTKDLAGPKLAYYRNTRQRQSVTMASAHDKLNVMTRILGLVRFRSRAWLDDVYAAFKLRETNARFRLMKGSHRKPWFYTASETNFRGKELERRAFVESMARLPVAR